MFRKVITVSALDSPNVQRGLEQVGRGETPDDRVITPGVITYSEYLKCLSLWDEVKKCVGLYGRFYEGAELMLFPSEWLEHSARVADGLVGKIRKAKYVGVDPAEGSDKTALCAIDELGIIDLISQYTSDTNVIPGLIKMFLAKHDVAAERCLVDRGGGGSQHADRLRAEGLKVRTVGFGEGATLDPSKLPTSMRLRIARKDVRYAFKNRRAEMYGTLSEMLNPSRDKPVFAIPREYVDLREELSPIPKLYENERLALPSKRKKRGDSTERCLVDIIGRSPDNADALVLAVWGMYNESRRPKATIH